MTSFDDWTKYNAPPPMVMKPGTPPGLQDEREGADRLLDRPLIELAAHPLIGDEMPADPQQPRQMDARRCRRLDVEHVERVDQRDQFAARGCGGDRLQQEAGAARGSRADELGELAARKPAAQPGV